MIYRILPRKIASITSLLISSNYIRLKWSYQLNVGDYLSPIIVKHISSYTPRYTSFDSNKPSLLAIGSILSRAKRDDVIWGSGFIKPGNKLVYNPYIISLRGKLSYDQLKNNFGYVKGHNISFGDPGLLLSDVYNPHQKKKYDVGYIPHFVDYRLFIDRYKKNIKENDVIINVKNNYKNIIRKINQCNYIASSSLHGLVLADAYKVPNTRIKLSDNIIGDDFKFDDYRSGINASTYNVIDLRAGTKLNESMIKEYSSLVDCEEIKNQIKFSLESYLLKNRNQLN